MPYRTSWDYMHDICAPELNAKPTYIENFLDMPEYVEKINLLLSLAPTELDDADLGQAWKDIANFQVAIKDFYDEEFNEYSADLLQQSQDLVQKTTEKRQAIEAEVDKRGLRYSFPNLYGWEPDYDNEHYDS